VPNTGSFVSVTTKVVRHTTLDNRLAVRILDMSYLPNSTFATTSSSSTQTTPLKRVDRWSGRVQSSPSKKIRHSSPTPTIHPESHSIHEAETNTSAVDLGSDSKVSTVTIAHQDNTASADANTDSDLSSTSSIPSQLSNTGRRPQRNRHPPKHLEFE